jgi:pimeloyl-ACP methyl ester carboxylesterase
MPLAPIANGKLYYETAGSGPPLLLVPGLAGSAHFWRLQVPRLAQRFTVVLHDHRGVGRSSRDAIVYSIEQMAGDVLALMDHLGIDDAALIGQSTGGAIGQYLAAMQPQRIARLVLSSTWTHADAYFRRQFELRRDMLRSAGIDIYTRTGTLLLYPAEWLRDHQGRSTQHCGCIIRRDPAEPHRCAAALRRARPGTAHLVPDAGHCGARRSRDAALLLACAGTSDSRCTAGAAGWRWPLRAARRTREICRGGARLSDRGAALCAARLLTDPGATTD